MAGFREFVTGEVLTAANVNDFLAKQAVMKFADAAARDAALGTAVVSPNALREGMVAYLDDEDAPSFYDGSAWGPISVPIAGIGSNVATAIETASFSTTSTSYQDITDLKVDFTPSKDDAKVLLIVSLTGSNSNTASGRYALGRVVADGNEIIEFFVSGSQQSNTFQAFGYTISAIHEPATTGIVTYQVQLRSTVSDSTAYTNRSRTGQTDGYASSITAIEVSG
jgi:hypothetical protein